MDVLRYNGNESYYYLNFAPGRVESVWRCGRRDGDGRPLATADLTAAASGAAGRTDSGHRTGCRAVRVVVTQVAAGPAAGRPHRTGPSYVADGPADDDFHFVVGSRLADDVVHFLKRPSLERVAVPFQHLVACHTRILFF